MAGLVGFPMYDFPWTRPAWRTVWRRLAETLRGQGIAEVPGRLTWRLPEHEVWAARDLLLGQTCGYPLMTRLQDRVRVVATPLHNWQGETAASYRSLLVVAAGSKATGLADLEGTRAAVNGRHSHSGCIALFHSLAELGVTTQFFGSVKISGSHAGSMAMVARGEADLAAIDMISYRLICRGRPGLAAGLRVLAASAPAPALPLITAGTTGDATLAKLRRSLMALNQDQTALAALARLEFQGFATLPDNAYQAILAMADRAATVQAAHTFA